MWYSIYRTQNTKNKLRGEKNFMATETQFQSQNDVTIAGRLVSKDIRAMHTRKDNIPMLVGRLQIETNEGERHYVQVLEMEYRGKDKKENPGYKTLLKLENEGVTLEDTKEASNVTQLKIFGQLTPNVYMNRNGEVVEGYQIQSRFLNVLEQEVKPESQVTCTGTLVTTPVPEINKQGDETGRMFADVMLVDYRNIGLKLKFTFPEEATDWLEDLEIATTVKLQAEIINRFINKTVELPNPDGFGTITEVKRDSTREMLVTGASEVGFHEDFDDEEGSTDHKLVLFPKQIQEAKKNYEQWKAEQIAQQEERQSKRDNNQGEVSGFTSERKSKPSKAKASNADIDDISDDDLPF